MNIMVNMESMAMKIGNTMIRRMRLELKKRRNRRRRRRRKE